MLKTNVIKLGYWFCNIMVYEMDAFGTESFNMFQMIGSDILRIAYAK